MSLVDSLSSRLSLFLLFSLFCSPLSSPCVLPPCLFPIREICLLSLSLSVILLSFYLHIHLSVSNQRSSSYLHCIPLHLSHPSPVLSLSSLFFDLFTSSSFSPVCQLVLAVAPITFFSHQRLPVFIDKNSQKMSITRTFWNQEVHMVFCRNREGECYISRTFGFLTLITPNGEEKFLNFPFSGH